MKKARLKNIFRTIRSSLSRFMAVLFIVALGAGFMAGLAATAPDMYDTLDGYADEYSWYDIDVKSTLGLTKEDILKIADIPEVSCVQAADTVDMVLTGSNEQEYTSRIFAFLDEKGAGMLNGFSLKEGRLPENTSECVIQKNYGRYADDTLGIGDTLTISKDNSNYDQLIDETVTDELTIVGYVEAPMCIAIYAETSTVGSGSISLELYTMEDFFDLDYYTDAYVTFSGAKELDTFSDEYRKRLDLVSDSIEDLGQERAILRTEDIRKELLDAADALEEMADRSETARQQGISLAQKSADSLMINAAAAELISAYEPELAEDLAETGQAVTGSLLNASEDDISSGLKENILSLADELRSEEEKTEDGRWIVADRFDAYGFSTYKSNIAKVGALAKLFPAFFFLVALLVALTTMTRLVEENRGQIGTLKALGYSNGQILGEYMFYSLLFSCLGCALGLAVGFRLFPSVICSAYKMMYIIPDIVTPFRMSIAAWVAPVSVGSIIAAAMIASWNEFRSSPAVTMRPKAPAAGKRIWLEHIHFIWSRLGFTRKVTMRNIFRYKKRFFMTVIGVAGCSALLLTGFGLRDSIRDIVDKQYGEIYKYDLVLAVTEEADEDEALETVLDSGELLRDHMGYMEETVYLSFGKTEEKIKAAVPEDILKTGGFISLRSRKGHEEYTIEDGVILTEKLCESLGINAGDTVTLRNEDGAEGEILVTAVAETYIGSFAYISAQSYERLFGKAPEMQLILGYWADPERSEEITSDLLENKNVIYVNSAMTLKKSFADSIKSINGVIYVLILSAGLLCIIVLYNLTNVNICERKKELATTRVLGFHRRETQDYIFRETNILSIIGGLIGLVLGLWLHAFVIRTVEVEQVMFGRNIYFLSFVYAMAITVIFTLLVNMILRRRIDRIDMVEAMKANE